MAARWCRVAQRLTGRQVKPRGAAWRPWGSHPAGRSCGRARRRHHSVAYRHTRHRSSLPRTPAGAARHASSALTGP